MSVAPEPTSASVTAALSLARADQLQRRWSRPLAQLLPWSPANSQAQIQTAWTETDVCSDAGKPSRSSTGPLDAALAASESMLTAVSQALVAPQEVEQTFLCPICCENCATTSRRVLAACGMEEHGTCEDCLRNYLQGRIDDARVDDLCCLLGSASSGCGPSGLLAKATEVDVEAIFASAPEVLDRYRRFKAKQADPHLRECPGCSALVAPSSSGDGRVVEPRMFCQGCEAVFCYYHSWAHRDELSCANYEANLAREAKTYAGLFGSKECPGCSWQTEKSGGCNHMTCIHCKCNWCWICGQAIHGSVQWHYDPTNPESGCLQFSSPSGHPACEAVRARRRAEIAGAHQLRIITCPIRALTKVCIFIALFVTFTLVLPMWVLFFGFFGGLCFACCDRDTLWMVGFVVPWCTALACGLFVGALMVTVLWLAWLPFAFLCFACSMHQWRRADPKGSIRALLLAPVSGIQDLLGDL
mmetsp:Transcript_13663/g.30580  ORF Transcript_13663/g.30580 Transcript_13663/m.30580 type:complete len:472 (+) Transcript_13663:71-1486(+)